MGNDLYGTEKKPAASTTSWTHFSSFRLYIFLYLVYTSFGGFHDEKGREEDGVHWNKKILRSERGISKGVLGSRGRGS